MKQNTLRLTALSLLCWAFSFTAKAAFTAPDHYLISYKLLYSYSQDSLDRFWKQRNIPQIIVPVRNSVDMYEITYKGLWLDSTFIMAKGVLYVPKVEKPSAEMVYCHGTRISVDQSYGIQDLEQVVCMMHSADGYIGIFPFYYGLGGGEKEHIYQDSWTEAMATIYMIKACREVYPQIGKKSSGQLFITGYSQGGHAAMATHKMLESGRFPEVQITGSSPMSGAYDMTGVQSKTMFEHYDRPHYLPYLILSYQYAYNLWPGNVYDVFKPEYRQQLEKVFQQPRQFDYGYVDAILPKVPAQMVEDSLIERFKTDTTFPFTRKLKENCLNVWVPKAPMQLCACYGDNEVMEANTEAAYAYMKQCDGNVHKKTFGKHLSHNPCAPFAIIYSKMFFDHMQKGKKHPEKMGFKGFLIKIAISIADRQAKKAMKKTGKVEDDPLVSRRKK